MTWTNRAWAAALFHWPAALGHESAVNRAGDVIHVAIDASRTATRLPQTRVHRLRDFDARVQWNRTPPRVRLEDALLSMASKATTRAEAVVVLSDACRRRLTTPSRLAAELARRPRITHRRWLRGVLQETAEGVQSLLEASYRRHVGLAHGLPRPDRQHRERTEDGIVYRDAEYRGFPHGHRARRTHRA